MDQIVLVIAVTVRFIFSFYVYIFLFICSHFPRILHVTFTYYVHLEQK